MCSVGYRVPYPPARLAAHSESCSHGDRRGDFPLIDHLQAVDRCLEKGWLTILTPEHFEAEQQRLHDSTVPEVLDIGYEPGHVDFTPAGYSLQRAIVGEIFGESHLQQCDAGCNFEDAFFRYDVYAPTSDLCSHLMSWRMDQGECFARPAHFVGATGPEPIGAWKPCRFITLPSGFYGRVQFS